MLCSFFKVSVGIGKRPFAHFNVFIILGVILKNNKKASIFSKCVHIFYICLIDFSHLLAGYLVVGNRLMALNILEACPRR